MRIKYLFVYAIVFTLTISSVPLQDACAERPDPRPLGGDFEAFHAAAFPDHSKTGVSESEEPEGVISLQQALSLAVMKNPELAAFSWDIRVAEARTLQSGLLPNPEMEAEVEEFGGTGELSGFDGSETVILLSQLIELGGKRSKRKKVATLEQDLAVWDYEARRLSVITETTKSFVDVVATQERLELNRGLVQLADNFLTTVSERVKAGKVSPIEEIKANVNLSSALIELDKVKRELETSRKKLAATWGSTSPLFERAKGQLDLASSVPSFNELAQAISQNPALARWSTEMEQRRERMELEKAGAVPDLTISGGAKYLNELNDTVFIVGLSIPLPLFDRNQGGYLEARSEQEKARMDRLASEVNVRTELVDAHERLSVSFAEAVSLRTNVIPGAQRAFDASSEGYRQGKFAYLDVLDTQQTLSEAKLQYIEALAAYHNAMADVEGLIGTSFEKIKESQSEDKNGGRQ